MKNDKSEKKADNLQQSDRARRDSKKPAITTNEYRKQPLFTDKKWEPLDYVDVTPNEGYVLRILQAHLINCKSRWGGTNDLLVKQMNKWQEDRETLLKKAIKILEAAHGT
jgi:hypothetical protein